jgi:hypothetical protein
MKIGLIPMAAKPYHAGHHALVEAAAGENEEVLLYISLSDRKRKGEVPIAGADMQTIWKEEIENILPGNVVPVYGGSPVRNVYTVLQDAEEKLVETGEFEHTYVIYSDPSDTSQNFPDANRMKYFPTLWQDGYVKFAAEENSDAFTRGVGTPDVSGTALRQSLESCDLATFESGMPSGVDAEKIFNMLCPSKRRNNENMLRTYIKTIIVG